jgi:hypothetical protein
MAEKIQAVKAYCPRIEHSGAATEERFMELITNRTTLSPGVVKNVQESEVETLIGLLLDGRPVHTGIAIYTPYIDLNGEYSVKVKVDKRVLRTLNTDGAFRGNLVNAQYIGENSEKLVALWNAEHPDDPVI